MLKRLEHKFVLINMLLIALVLVVVFTTVVVMNRNQRVSEVNDALTASTNIYDSEGNGTAPGITPNGGFSADSDTFPDAAQTTDDNNGDAANSQQTGSNGGNEAKHEASKLVSTSTYLLNDDYSVSSVKVDSLSLDDTTLANALSEISESDAETGTLSDLGLYYQIRPTSTGYKVAFASTDYVNSTTLSLIMQLLVVGLVALAAFLVISIFLSKWALRPVKGAWAQQQQFVADASHELKTPLTVLLANNSILMEHPERSVGSQMQWVESSETEAHLMQQLVNDLLFLAKPDDSQQQLVSTTVDLSNLVESNLLQFESVAFEKDIQLSSDIDEGITISGNETRIQRLVGTLIDNACKYATTGTTVSASLKHRAHEAVFSINNHGEVISHEDQQHIFDRFWRADKARVRAQGGYGLGLAIAKEIADEHGASIDVQSDEEHGTTFTVAFREGH